MEARVATLEEFVCFYLRNPEDFLSRIIIMDESSVAFHTPEMKSQSKQWLPKGSPAPLKGKDQASRKKQYSMTPASYMSTSPLLEPKSTLIMS